MILFKVTLADDAIDAASTSSRGRSFVLKLKQSDSMNEGNQGEAEGVAWGASAKRRRGQREAYFYEAVSAMARGHQVDGLTHEALHGLGGPLLAFPCRLIGAALPFDW